MTENAGQAATATGDGQVATPPVAHPPPGAVLIDILERLSEGREIFFNVVKTVGDVMNVRSRPLTMDNKVEAAWKRFEEEGLSELPLIDEIKDDKDRNAPVIRNIMGTIRKRSLCAILSSFAGSRSQTEADEKAMKSPLGSLMTRGAPTLTRNDSIFRAAEIMLKTDLECLAVVEGTKDYLGSVGLLDLLKCMVHLDSIRRARSSEPKDDGNDRIFDLLATRSAQPTDLMLASFLARAQDVMTKNVCTVKIDDRIEEAVRLMQQKKIRHLVVVDATEKFKNVLTDQQLLLHLPAPSEKLTRSQKAEPLLEKGPVYLFDPDEKETRQKLGERVGDALTSGKPDYVAPEEGLLKIIELLSGPGSGAVVVASPPQLKPKGIITRVDLLRAFFAIGELLKKQEQ